MAYSVSGDDLTGHKLYRISPHKQEHVQWLEEVRENVSSDENVLDFWGDPILGNDLLVRVPPLAENNFLANLKIREFGYRVEHDNIQQLVNSEKGPGAENSTISQRSMQSAAGRYAPLDDIYRTMKNLASQYSHMSIINVGESFEGRELLVAKFSTGSGKKPSIFINGGHHAREWIASASVVWVLNEFATSRKTSNDVKSMLCKFDVYLMPVINVDGYAYTHASRSNRLWRKTRSTHGSSSCVGTDPNRNWDMHFAGEGTSSNPCSDIYHGPHAFSEPETKAVSAFLTKLKSYQRLTAYYDIHAFSQMWFIPYAYTRNAVPDDYDELERVARVGAAALQTVNGLRFQVGTAASLLYPAAGGVDDWAKGELKVKYSYCLELRPSGGGSYGFIVSSSQIPSSGKELLRGLSAAAQAMRV